MYNHGWNGNAADQHSLDTVTCILLGQYFRVKKFHSFLGFTGEGVSIHCATAGHQILRLLDSPAIIFFYVLVHWNVHGDQKVLLHGASGRPCISNLTHPYTLRIRSDVCDLLITFFSHTYMYCYCIIAIYSDGGRRGRGEIS